MRRLTTFAIIALATCTFYALPAAHAAEYELDTAHSEVLFKVKHMTISTVTGRFKEFDGSFEFDPASSKLTKVNSLIQTTSISTNNDKRDDHLRSPDFFDAANFPTITFASKGVTPGKDGHYDLKGDLTMHGVTKPIVLDVVLNGTVKDPWGNQRAAFTATGKLNRQDYGVKWSKTLDNGGLVAGDEVQIEIAVEGVEKKAEADAAKPAKK